jgi:cysteine desulfurase
MSYNQVMFSKRRTYLDWAAAAPASRAAVFAYATAARDYGNPSSPHEEGRRAKQLLEDARTMIAREVGAKSDDIIFTSGATEANNLAIRGLARPGAHILYLPSAHSSTVETVSALQKEGVITAEPLVIKNGEVDIEALKKQIRPETILVTMDRVCSETGTIWNTREVSNVLHSNVGYGVSHIKPILHVDATQSPLEESVEKTRIGADLMTLDAQKVGGMRGLGVLATPRAIPLSSLMTGGGQERGLRSGTPVPALAYSFATALGEVAEGRDDFVMRALAERTDLIALLSQIPNVFVNQGKRGAGHILNLSLIGRDTDYLVALLDEAGFAVSTKSACESDSSQGSRAVLALTNDTARAQSTLRISWGPVTKKRELEAFARVFAEAVQFLDRVVY